MFEKYYEKIYKVLQSAGEGGATVGKIARQIKHAKSTTWGALQEMVERELIDRVENYDHTDYKQVRYFYFQLPLFNELNFSQTVHNESDYNDGWDGLRGCSQCGNDTTGTLCHQCAHQAMIDREG